MRSDVAAKLRARCIVFERTQQGAQRAGFIAELMQTGCELAARLNVIFYPALPAVQKSPENLRCLFVLSMPEKFTCIVKLFTRTEGLAARDQLFKDTQIAVRIAGAQLAVGNGDICMKDLSGGCYCFVNRARPGHAGAAPD